MDEPHFHELFATLDDEGLLRKESVITKSTPVAGFDVDRVLF